MINGSILGWKLPPHERERLLDRFPPRYQRVIADHVTLEVGSPKGELPLETEGLVVGRADDQESLECLVVEIGGTSGRPDGSTYHITWSLGPDRRAKDSNDVLAAQGWDPIDDPVRIDLRPARF